MLLWRFVKLALPLLALSPTCTASSVVDVMGSGNGSGPALTSGNVSLLFRVADVLAESRYGKLAGVEGTISQLVQSGSAIVNPTTQVAAFTDELQDDALVAATKRALDDFQPNWAHDFLSRFIPPSDLSDEGVLDILSSLLIRRFLQPIEGETAHQAARGIYFACATAETICVEDVPGILRALQKHGIAVVDGAFGSDFAALLGSEIQRLHAADLLRPSPSHAAEMFAPRAGGDGLLLPRVNGVRHAWEYEVDGVHLRQLREKVWKKVASMLRGMDLYPLRAASHAMAAWLPAGGQAERRHYDAGAGEVASFLISAVYFPGAAGDGGAAWRFALPGERTLEVVPQPDRLILLDSVHAMHEVLPTQSRGQPWATVFLRSRTGFGDV